MRKAAIVILNYNGEHMLQKFLPDVIRYSAYDVIVADNASTDGSLDFLQKKYAQVNTISLDANHGFSGGYNLALERIRGEYEYYILLNSDILVTPDWDQKMIGWLDRHPQVVASQPKILSYQQQTHFDHAGAGGGFLDRLGYPYCRGRIFDHTEEDVHQYDDCVPVDWASGACLFIRADDFHVAGGFDPLFFAHMEEIDLCWRLRLSGKQIFYNGEVTVYHVNGGTLSKNSPTKTYLNFRNNLLMLFKNLPKNQFLKVFVIRIFLDTAALVHFSFTEGLAHGKAVISAYLDFLKFKSSVKKTVSLASKLTKEDQDKRISSVVISFYIKSRKTYPQL